MNSIGGWIGAIVMATALVIHPQESRAEGFTGKDFEGWARSQQDSYIQISVTMAGMVFTQVQPEISTCVDSWYFAGSNMAARNDYLRRLIAENPTYHPSGVILAAVLKKCGPIKK